MNKVIEARANIDHTLDLRFNDGSYRRFDVKPYLEMEVFQELQNINYFSSVSVAYGTVRWPHEQDISPDTLYLESELIN